MIMKFLLYLIRKFGTFTNTKKSRYVRSENIYKRCHRAPWKPLSGAKDYKTNSQLILHIVTSWQGSAASGSPAKDEMLAVLDYSGYIQKVLTGLKGEAFCNLALSETNTNHNHEDILENIDVYNYTGNITL